MEMNQVNTPGEEENHQEDHAANQGDSQDTGKDNQNGSGGEDEQADDVNSSDISADDEHGKSGHTTGTDGSNDEKADNTPENARRVRDNDDSEGEE